MQSAFSRTPEGKQEETPRSSGRAGLGDGSTSSRYAARISASVKSPPRFGRTPSVVDEVFSKHLRAQAGVVEGSKDSVKTSMTDSRQGPIAERHTQRGPRELATLGTSDARDAAASISRPSERTEGSNAAEQHHVRERTGVVPSQPAHCTDGSERGGKRGAPPSKKDRLSDLGLHTTHSEHNRLMHATHGNTSTGAKAGPTGMVKDGSGVLTDLPKNKDGNAVHPGRAEALSQWKRYNKVWSQWWTAARVLDGALANPFQMFPQSFTFARRIIDPQYDHAQWTYFLPILCISVDGEPVPYQGQEGVNLATGGLMWFWPQMIVMMSALLSAINSSGKVYSVEDLNAIATQTPEIISEAKQTIVMIRNHLTKILNMKTAKRTAKYAEVVADFKTRILEVQYRADKARDAYRLVQKEMSDLLVERDEQLAINDGNYERKKVSLEDQMAMFGLQDLPLAAKAAQKRAPTLAPRPALEEESDMNTALQDLLDGK
uniref:Uncharacterized protein n=1 Tax=viral metagenome TaxID=1070528 RepID=A0A2V0RJC8_9ZZZZ